MIARLPDPIPARLAELAQAWRFLTRLPLPTASLAAQRGTQPLAAAMWAFPIIGGVLGLGAGLVAAALMVTGLPAGAGGAVALAALAVASGGLHTDGLADFGDGLAAGGDAARRLAAMRDRQLGAHGALGLVLVVGLQLVSLAAASSPLALLGLVMGSSALAQAAMVGVTWAMPSASGNGLAAGAGRPGAMVAGTAGAVAVALAVLTLGPAGAIRASLGAAAGAGLVGVSASRLLGGVSGDVLGAAHQVALAGALAAALGGSG